MTNLLPLSEKKEFFLANCFKLSLILGVIFLTAFGVLILILFQVDTYLTDEIFAVNGQDRPMQEKMAEIQGVNQKIDALKAFYVGQVKFGESLTALSQVFVPNGVRLANIALANKELGLIGFSVYGFAESREQLLEFKKNIEFAKNVKDINFSQESWVKNRNINFYFTFVYENKE